MPSTSSDWMALQPLAHWVARMTTKRPAPTGAGKSPSERGGPDEGYSRYGTQQLAAGQGLAHDVSRNYDDLWGAVKDAYQGDQLALYDIDRNKTGETDEAGWMTGAPWMVGRRHDRP